MVRMLLSFSILRLRYFIYGLLMVLAELCLLFSALLFVILALLKLLSFDFAFVFGFVFLAILNWYLFEHFHVINFSYTYDVYNLLSKAFYSLLALRVVFLTVIATYSIIGFVFINFELFVAEACGGEVIKAGTKVASAGSSKVHENFFKLFVQEGLNNETKKIDRLDAIVAGSIFDNLVSKSDSLKAIENMANQQKIDKFTFNASREEMNLTDNYLWKLYKGKKIKYFPLYDEYNFMTRLKRMEPHFILLNKVVNSKSANLYTLLYDNPFKDNNVDQQEVKFDKTNGLIFLNFLKATTVESTDGGVLYLKKPSLLFGDPARLNNRKLNLEVDNFDLVFFFENLKHRIHSETFEVAEPRPDASEAVKPGKGVGDFVAKFKGDKEVTYCEGKTAYFNSKHVVSGYLTKENYSVFETNIHNYLIDKLKNITTTNDAVEDDNREVLKQKMVEHPQLIYHISKGRQVAYVFNFPDIYTKDPELLLRIEKELNGREDIIKYIPSKGAIRLACSKLNDKIIQFEKLD